MAKGSRTKHWRQSNRKRRFKARKARHAKGEIGPSGHQRLKIVKKPTIDKQPRWGY